MLVALVSFTTVSASTLREEELEVFLANFTAADPAYHDWCLDSMKGSKPAASQDTQDVFVWRNLFLDRTIRGERGFYVDSGANDYRKLSNTFFFDKCLGWDGLCVEADPQYHAGIRAHRSCKLVPQCISNSAILMPFKFTRVHVQLARGHVVGHTR